MTNMTYMTGKSKRIVQVILWIVFIGYTALLVYWMFAGFGRVRHETGGLRYNLVPFRTIKNYFVNFHHFHLSTWVINVFGNIGVFMPFGVLLPALFRRARRWYRFYAAFISALLALELLQMLLHVGSFDVDDLILNSIGALAAYFLNDAILRRQGGGG